MGKVRWSSTHPLSSWWRTKPLLRAYAAETFGELGFLVLEADNADAARVLLELWPDVRVLFTDLRMPGATDGAGLATIVAAQWPHIEIIVTSGHARPAEDELPLRAHFLPKPYLLADLVDSLEGRCGVPASTAYRELRAALKKE